MAFMMYFTEEIDKQRPVLQLFSDTALHVITNTISNICYFLNIVICNNKQDQSNWTLKQPMQLTQFTDYSLRAKRRERDGKQPSNA